MEFKAVLFDLDGTLLDTLEDLGHAVNRVLKKGGFPTHPVEGYRRLIGKGSRVLVKRALPEGKRDEETVTACLKAFLADYGQNWNVMTKPYDGVPRMLDAVSARGIKMAVLSNKGQDFTVRCVTEFLPHWHFDAVLGERDGIPPKPDPAAALEIAGRLKIPPDAFLHLGDTAVDMKTAVGAGMYPVGVLWGFRASEELLKSGARDILNHPTEITRILDNPPTFVGKNQGAPRERK